MRAKHWVRLALAAEASGCLPAVKAIAPVADAEAHIRFGEDFGNIGIDIARSRAPAERRSLGEHDARLPRNVRSQEQVFQRLAGFFGGLLVDQLGKLEVGADIGPVGHRAVDMPEMALQRRQAGAVAPPDEPRERLAPLIGGQAPGAASVVRQGEERRKPLVQADIDHG